METQSLSPKNQTAPENSERALRLISLALARYLSSPPLDSGARVSVYVDVQTKPEEAR